MIKIAGDIIILHVYQKSQAYAVRFRKQSETDRSFCYFGQFFILLLRVRQLA